MIHARIQEFRQLGVGSRSIWHIKKGSDNVFFYFLFFKTSTFFYRSPVATFKENYYLPRFQWGENIFQGGPTFYRGSNCFFPIETHITCNFPGVGPDPLPPSGSAHVIPRIVV